MNKTTCNLLEKVYTKYGYPNAKLLAERQTIVYELVAKRDVDLDGLNEYCDKNLGLADIDFNKDIKKFIIKKKKELKQETKQKRYEEGLKKLKEKYNIE